MGNNDLSTFLKNLTKISSFSGRIGYCNGVLSRIGSGSGRIVYEIDNDTVLKLAKNSKGLSQNNEEATISADNYNHDMVAKVLQYDNDDKWIVSERVKKVNEKRIKEITGIPSLKELDLYLRQIFIRGANTMDINSPLFEELSENEWIVDLVEIISNYGLHVGDFGRISSYGEVDRYNTPSIVLSDYGLGNDVYATYYDKSSKYQIHEVIDMNRGGIYQEFSDNGDEIRNSMWAYDPYSVSDGPYNINMMENFINFVENDEELPLIRRPIFKINELKEEYKNAIHNYSQYLKNAKNKKSFVENLMKIGKKFNEDEKRHLYNSQSFLYEEDNENTDKFDAVESMKIAKEISLRYNLENPIPYFCGIELCIYTLGDKYLVITSVVNNIKDDSNLGKLYLRARITNKETNEKYWAIITNDINYYDTNVNEDGSSLYSTANGVGRDDFPTYNNVDTSPSIENDLNANSWVYNELSEYLDYMHVTDADKDKYKLGIESDVNERNISYMPNSKIVKIKDKCKLGGLGTTSAQCNQGDVSNLDLTNISELNNKNMNVTDNTINAFINDRRDVGFLQLQDSDIQLLHDNGYKVVPIRQEGDARFDNNVYVVYQPEAKQKATDLYRMIMNNGGKIPFNTPEDVRKIGRILGYSSAAIEQFVLNNF